MGAADSAKSEEDARLQAVTANPSPPPPDRASPSPPSHSLSPGSGSGTTQSASPEDREPLEPAEDSSKPGANPSKPSDPDSWQGLIDAVSNGRPVKWPGGSSHQPCPSNAAPDHDSALQGQGGGAALPSGGLAPCVQQALHNSTQRKRQQGNAGIQNGFGDHDLQPSPPVSPPAVKLEFETHPGQQAQCAGNVLVKPEPSEDGDQGGVLEEEASFQGQGHWQAALETQHAQHAEEACQPTKPRLKWTPELHARFTRCVVQLGGPQKAKARLILQMMSDTQGLTTERVQNHLQRLRRECNSGLRLPEFEPRELSLATSNAEGQTGVPPISTMDSDFPPSQACFPPSQIDLSHPNGSHDFTFPSQPPPHAQHLSAADAEAQLFFTSPSPASLPAACMVAPKPDDFAGHPPGGSLAPLPRHSRSLQNQHLYAQQQLYLQQQQQQQWLSLQHGHHLMLERHQQHQQHQQQRYHQQQQQQHQRSMAFSSGQQQSSGASQASQGLQMSHPQDQLPLPGGDPAQHAEHAVPAASSQLPASLNPIRRANCLSGPSHDSQHAKHGANGFSNQEQSARPHQKGQHAQHGANVFSNTSMQSMQGGQLNSRSGSGASTAFILWVDGQYKARGQVEKRAALRGFVQSAKVCLLPCATTTT